MGFLVRHVDCVLVVFGVSALLMFGTAITIDDCPESLTKDKYLKVLDNTCFRFELKRKESYFSARRFCEKANDGSLAMPKSQRVNKFIAKQLADDLKTKEMFWIGLDDRQRENKYVWNDGTPVTNYHNFDSNEGPKNKHSHHIEDCVVLDPSGGKSGAWRDTRCNKDRRHRGHYFVCQYSAVPKPTTIQSSTTRKIAPILLSNPGLESCPPALVRDEYLRKFGSFCYLFERGQSKTRVEAQKFCRSKGGSLVKLNSTPVNNFVKNMLVNTFKSTAPAWIGLNDVKRENVFKWADGSPMTFVNFEPNKGWQNPSGKSKDCVVINPKTGKWRDIHCQSRIGAPSYLICEFPVQEQVSTTSSPPPPPSSSQSSTTTVVRKMPMLIEPTPYVVSIVKSGPE